MHRLLTIIAVFVSGLSNAENLFSLLENHFKNGTLVTLSSVNSQEMWGGKCAKHMEPTKAIAGMMDTYLMGDPNDPLFPVQKYVTVNTYQDRPDSFFVQMTSEVAKTWHISHFQRIHEWQPALNSSDPLNPHLTFPWRMHWEELIYGLDFTVKRSSLNGGPDFYVVRGACPFNSCEGGLGFGGSYLYCYFWSKK